MNFMNRAWLYIVRKRGKSILLFVILLVMATFVLTALALGNASKAAQQELRQSLGGSFLIGFDYTENNPYLKVESVDGGTLMYSTQQISPELVEQIRGIEGIKECSATVEGLAAFPSLELFTGNIPIEEEFRASSKILSTWKSEELTWFTSGQLTLTQGRHILPDDKNKGLISKDLAEKNGLKIGDKIQTDKGVEIEIVGLFSPKEIEGINDQVTTYDKIQNLIITDLATLVAYENGPAIQGFNELTVSVDDPQNMEEIISKVKEISGVDWKGFSFLVDNEDYENAASSLEQLSELVSTILMIALMVSIAILSLILTMWARTRIHETGVLLSVGISKLSILGQYIAEVLLIAIFAFSLSYFLRIMFYLICNIENVGKYHLYDRICTVCRNVRNNDSTFFRFFNINYIVTCCQNANIFQCRKCVHFLFQDTNFIGQYNFCTLTTFGYFIFLRVFVDMTLT